MQTVIVISPEYLTGIYKEAKKYSFVIQGYGSFANAINGLHKVPAKDLLGVACLLYTIPQVGSKEYEAFNELLHLITLYEDEKRFVVITQTSSVKFRNEIKGIHGADIVLFDEEEEITDITINQKIFGTVLKKTREPYIFEKKKVLGEESSNVDFWKLKLDTVLSEDELQLMSPIAMLDDAQQTVLNDRACARFRDNKNRLLLAVRQYEILKLFKEDVSVIRAEINMLLEKEDVDTILWCIIRCLLGG